MAKIEWDENTIREEMARLDAKTGLSGHTLPMRFTAAKCVLGCYYEPNARGEGERFHFSGSFFADPHTSEKSKRDVVLHEYAHYLCYHRYGAGHGHDREWKACCRTVGALPQRLFNRELEQQYLKRELQREQQCAAAANYAARFVPGTEMQHARYGKGVIRAVDAERGVVTVEFAAPIGQRRLGMEWLMKHSGVE